jgi:phosphoserine phosphatase RsbU/P
MSATLQPHDESGLPPAAAAAATAAPEHRELTERQSGPAALQAVQAILPELGPGLLDEQLDAVQREVNSLRGELDLLRRRDETLNFYMQRLDEELRLAARLQQDFLPKSLPQLGRVRFHTLYRPAGYVSGDLYDVMRLDERRVGFYMADAVGHGMPAALLTMFVKQALVTKEITATGYRLLDPAEALGRLNVALLEQGLSHSNFCTAVYGILDVETLEVRLARAGHPAPLLLRADDRVEPLGPDGALLGIFPDETFASGSVRLAPGDRLVVYTDGVDIAFPDERDHDISQRPPRWQEELVRRRPLPAEHLLADFGRHLDDTAGSLDPRDDLTMMVIDVAT